jgi:CRISPR-associated protein Cmr2
VGEGEQAELVLAETEKRIQDLFGNKPEAYYALLLMDGDRLGAWISGTDEAYRLPYERFWHSKIRNTLNERVKDGPLRDYLDALRPSSPARHMALSGALSSFALQVTRYVLEDLYKGKLIYAGGDDVLAMICIDDLLPAMQTLRYVYSGVFPQGEAADEVRHLLRLPSERELKIGKGHLRLFLEGRNRLFRMMGSLATASVGAVVAHHMAPLSRVVRTLRLTEQRAKQCGGRNAFAVTLMKRGGGAVELTCPWFEKDAPTGPGAVELLIELRSLIASERMSRRAVYLVQEWARGLPSIEAFEAAGGTPEGFRSMMEKTLARQFRRQAANGGAEDAGTLAQRIVAVSWEVQGRTCRQNPWDFIIDFMSVAEFLAREGRA